MSASTAPTPNGRSGRKIAGALTILALIAVGIFYVASALTDTTASNDNFFESGTLSITDDNTDSNALFEVENVNDGSTGAKCITVTNDGTIAYDALTLTRSAGVGALGEDVTFTVTRLDSGNDVDTTGGDCTEFDAQALITPPDTLTGVGGTADTAADQAVGGWLSTPGNKASYKFSYVVDMDNTDQSQDVTDIDIAWSASQG